MEIKVPRGTMLLDGRVADYNFMGRNAQDVAKFVATKKAGGGFVDGVFKVGGAVVGGVTSGPGGALAGMAIGTMLSDGIDWLNAFSGSDHEFWSEYKKNLAEAQVAQSEDSPSALRFARGAATSSLLGGDIQDAGMTHLDYFKAVADRYNESAEAINEREMASIERTDVTADMIGAAYDVQTSEAYVYGSTLTALGNQLGLFMAGPGAGISSVGISLASLSSGATQYSSSVSADSNVRRAATRGLASAAITGASMTAAFKLFPKVISSVAKSTVGRKISSTIGQKGPRVLRFKSAADPRAIGVNAVRSGAYEVGEFYAWDYTERMSTAAVNSAFDMEIEEYEDSPWLDFIIGASLGAGAGFSKMKSLRRASTSEAGTRLSRARDVDPAFIETAMVSKTSPYAMNASKATDPEFNITDMRINKETSGGATLGASRMGAVQETAAHNYAKFVEAGQEGPYVTASAQNIGSSDLHVAAIDEITDVTASIDAKREMVDSWRVRRRLVGPSFVGNYASSDNIKADNKLAYADGLIVQSSNATTADTFDEVAGYYGKTSPGIFADEVARGTEPEEALKLLTRREVIDNAEEIDLVARRIKDKEVSYDFENEMRRITGRKMKEMITDKATGSGTALMSMMKQQSLKGGANVQ